ncbi:MAG TPA: hypothetical protein VET65_02015, partial [Candidatus Limnocylindrales bacterium]|nr:hypothetical protein [Candidatus Limnocylindrales bacterium]
NNLAALVGPTASPAWPTDLVNGDRFIFGTSSIAAIVGYPIVVVPMGFTFGLPLGISFFGTAFSEPTLIKLAYAFEQATHFRQQPQFLPTLNAGAGEPPDERPRRGQPNLQQTGDRPRHL